MVHDNKDGTYYVSYTPKEPGTYTVLVCVKEQHVQVSEVLPTLPWPFTLPLPQFCHLRMWRHFTQDQLCRGIDQDSLLSYFTSLEKGPKFCSSYSY